MSQQMRTSVRSAELRPHNSVLYYVSSEDKAPEADLGLAGIKVEGLGPPDVRRGRDKI